jgi:hypothetical protein
MEWLQGALAIEEETRCAEIAPAEDEPPSAAKPFSYYSYSSHAEHAASPERVVLIVYGFAGMRVPPCSTQVSFESTRGPAVPQSGEDRYCKVC